MRWVVLRLVLGFAQMAGAVGSAVLLVRTGINEASLGAVAVTCLLTTLSVLLFGSRAPKKPKTPSPTL